MERRFLVTVNGFNKSIHKPINLWTYLQDKEPNFEKIFFSCLSFLEMLDLPENISLKMTDRDLIIYFL